MEQTYRVVGVTLCMGLAAAVAGGLAGGVSAERLPMRVLTTADGLPGDQIACVHGDARGFVWICTAEGLTRWDGHTAVTFGAADGLTSRGVRSFLRTRSGRYWVGTRSGLFEFAAADSQVGHFHHVTRDDDEQYTGTVYALAESRDGSLWIGTGTGLARLHADSTGGRLHYVDIGMPADTENDRIVRALVEDEDGTLWIGGGSGVYARSPDGRTVRIAAREGLPDNQVWALAVGQARTIWVGTRSGLARLDRRNTPIVQRVFTESDGLTSANIRSLHVSGNSLWIGSVGGVAEATPNARGGLTIERTIGGFHAWDVLEDARGDVWIATETGVRKLTRHGFTGYTEEDGLGADNAVSIFVTPAGEVCATLVTRAMTLACLTGSRFARYPIAATRKIADLGWGWSQLVWQDRRGRWWIPTGEGLLQFAAGPAAALAFATPAAVYDVRKGLASNSIFRVFEDSDGGIWVTTWAETSTGLARIDPETARVRPFTAADGLPDALPPVYAFAEGPDGTVWIGLQHRRVLRYRDGRFEELPLGSPDGTSTPTNEDIRSLIVDTRHRLWVASTASGLGRVDDPDAPSPRVRWYGTKQGLSSNVAWAIAEHASGDIVVGTGRGVDRLQPDSGRITHYAAEDGVPRGEIHGITRDRTGHIWLATSNGVARLATTDAPASTPPATVVTAIRLGGVPLGVAADGVQRVTGVRVGPGVPAVEIDYVSPGARAADGLAYQQRTIGGGEWVTSRARTVTFATPSPGVHRFEVRAILASGIAGEPAVVEFTVLAPVWARAWFVSLVAAVLAGAVWLLHRARVERLLAIQRVRSQIAADLHDGVGARLSRIAVLSEVVRQQAEASLPAALPALAAIGENAREVIDDMSDAVWFVDARSGTLEDVLGRLRALATELFETQAVRWTIEVPPDTPRTTLTPEQRRHLYLSVKEALTNIARHAHAAEVLVRVVTSPGSLRVEISDDGVGLDSAAARQTSGSGRGLENLRGRARMLGGRLSIASGEARGTRIQLEIPLAGQRTSPA